MKSAEAILSVKFKSTLNPQKLIKACKDDLKTFRNVPGLLQKYYVAEEATGAISGFYIFENSDARTAFWNSELAKNIVTRYGVIPESLRVEEYEMVIVLKDVVLA
jgi:putative monooxygenase ydhR